MARVTVEDCLNHIDNQFELTAVAAKRSRQLVRGATAHLPWEDDKTTVMALREIAEGQVTKAILDEIDLPPLPTVHREEEDEATPESAAPQAAAPPISATEEEPTDEDPEED